MISVQWVHFFKIAYNGDFNENFIINFWSQFYVMVAILLSLTFEVGKSLASETNQMSNQLTLWCSIWLTQQVKHHGRCRQYAIVGKACNGYLPKNLNNSCNLILAFSSGIDQPWKCSERTAGVCGDDYSLQSVKSYVKNSNKGFLVIIMICI